MTFDTKSVIETWVPRLRKLKIRQYQFAKMAGINHAQLSGYVSDRVKPNMTSFEKIENKLQELEADRR